MVIDCVGLDGKKSAIETLETALRLQAGSKSAIEIASQAVRKGGTVSMVGVYGGRYNNFHLGDFFARNITLKMGQCPAHAYVQPILELIQGMANSTQPTSSRTGCLLTKGSTPTRFSIKKKTTASKWF